MLCGRAAAYLLRILKCGTPPPPEVMTTTERRIPGVKTKRVRHTDRRDVTQVKGIACTTPARTIVDLAPEMDDDPFARVCHEAGVLHRTTPRQVKAVMGRRGRRRGAARIRRVMYDCRWTDLGVTVELVSFKFHNSKYSWDQDHGREREARSRGDEWRSFTYDDVFEDQTYMLAELRKLLLRPAP